MPRYSLERKESVLKKLLPPENQSVPDVAQAGMSNKKPTNDSLKDARNEIKQLKRKVHRKDRALAESAALLVLSKKFQALWEDEDQ